MSLEGSPFAERALSPRGRAAALRHVALSPDSLGPTVGASGAIAAALGAYIVLFRRDKVLTMLLPLFFLPFELSAWVLLGVWFVMRFSTKPGLRRGPGSARGRVPLRRPRRRGLLPRATPRSKRPRADERESRPC